MIDLSRYLLIKFCKCPREIVKRTLNYENPVRVAHSFEEPDLYFSRHNAKTHETGWMKFDRNRWEKTDEWGKIKHLGDAVIRKKFESVIRL